MPRERILIGRECPWCLQPVYGDGSGGYEAGWRKAMHYDECARQLGARLDALKAALRAERMEALAAARPVQGALDLEAA